jgi:hypothetical protein
MGRAYFLMPAGFERYDGAVYRELGHKAASFTKYRYTGIGNSVDDTLIGLKNSFFNVEVMSASPGIRQLEQKYKGVPAIVVAAGPSLDKNIDLLREAQGKALIIASDITLKVLLTKGIIPDLVASIERVSAVYERFYHGVDIPDKTWLVALNVMDPRVFKAFPNRHVIAFRTTEPLSSWLDDVTGKKGGLMTGLSVAHLAFSTARLLGCEPIILVGQDLALSKDNRYYVSGSSSGDGEDISGDVWVKDYNGEPIRSTRILKLFLDWYEMALRDEKVHCIDATEGGALIEGTEVLTLRETLDRYCLSRNGFPEIKGIIQSPAPVPLEKILESVLEFRQRFIDIIDMLEEGLYELQKLENNGEIELRKQAVQIQEILNYIYEHISLEARTAFTLQAVTSNAATRFSNLGQLASERDMKEFINYTRKFFGDLAETAEVCILALDGIVRDLKTNIRDMLPTC